MTVKELHKILEIVPETYQIQFGDDDYEATLVAIEHHVDAKIGYVVIK